MALKIADLRAIIKKEDATMDEKVSELLDLFHTEIDTVKDERDELKDTVADLKKNDKTKEYEDKYKKLNEEYEAYKTEQETSKSKTEKENAYRALLKESGVSEKAIDKIVKVTDIDALKVTDGKLENTDELKATIKTDWSEFVTSTQTVGAQTQTPPANTGAEQPDLSKMTMAEYIKARKGE